MAAQIAGMKKMKPLQNYSLANHGQWSVIALPSAGWAKKVFPEKNEQEAVEELWKAILNSVRIELDNDPVSEWQKHNERLNRYCRILNDHSFEKLHFESSTGTDLTVGLVENHIWLGETAIQPRSPFQSEYADRGSIQYAEQK